MPAFPRAASTLSEESVATCRHKGLDAETADLFAYLNDLPEASLDGIFCSQVVEHLPPERLPRNDPAMRQPFAARRRHRHRDAQPGMPGHLRHAFLSRSDALPPHSAGRCWRSTWRSMASAGWKSSGFRRRWNRCPQWRRCPRNSANSSSGRWTTRSWERSCKRRQAAPDPGGQFAGTSKIPRYRWRSCRRCCSLSCQWRSRQGKMARRRSLPHELRSPGRLKARPTFFARGLLGL